MELATQLVIELATDLATELADKLRYSLPRYCKEYLYLAKVPAKLLVHL